MLFSGWLLRRSIFTHQILNICNSKSSILRLQLQVAISAWGPFNQSLTQKTAYAVAHMISIPQKCLARGYERISPDQLVEEETLPAYHPKHYYPAQIGELFEDRFQILSKLGFGSSSTIWLARDLQLVFDHNHIVLLC